MRDRLRRLFGLRYIRVLDKVEYHTQGVWGVRGTILEDHYEWQRVRPWWKFWAK